MPDYNGLVSVAVDLSRLRRDPYTEIQLRKLLALGRQVDLLEALRRTERSETLTVERIIIHATGMGIDSETVESRILPLFEESKMLAVEGTKVRLNYDTTKEVYDYGVTRFKASVREQELTLANVVCESGRRPIGLDELDSALQMFPSDFRAGLRRFLLDNSILTSFKHKGVDYIVSPRIYKNESKFKQALEALDGHRMGRIIEFLQENPGNPLPVVEGHLGTDENTLKLLGQSGIIDPVRLDVHGDMKDYLFSSDILSKRADKDHFDLVRKTLANFRFGEYYSNKKRLYDLDRFLEYMLDHGYAGKAEPIGTDYMNLEWAGVFRIEPISGTKNFRFWMLKRDVIEDAHSVLRGYVPIQSDQNVGQLSQIDGVVKTRSFGVGLSASAVSEIGKALREIEKGLTSS